MSYIVPQKMPLRCFECMKISSSTIDGYSCSIAHKSLASEHGINVGRPDWCPLIEIPTPHGRLVDATFEENHYASILLDPTPDVTEQDKHKARIIIEALRMARTVIGAEGETE